MEVCNGGGGGGNGLIFGRRVMVSNNLCRLIPGKTCTSTGHLMSGVSDSLGSLLH